MNISHTEAPKVFKSQLDKVHGVRYTSKASSTRASEELVLSDKATEMQLAKENISNIPDMRVDVVKRFKRQVEAGSYGVSGMEVADSMFASALQSRTKL